MAGYSKLFSSIVTSTVWTSESMQTRLVWITLLAMSDANGYVEGSVPGIAHQARVTLQEAEEALERLSMPDPYSRTPDHDGRRIESVRGGWLILNYVDYRNRCQAKDGSRARYERERRAGKRGESHE